MVHQSPYVHRSCIASTCVACHGAGVVTVTRARWIGGSRNGYRSTWSGEVRCDACSGYGETYRSEFATIDPEPPTPAAPEEDAVNIPVEASDGDTITVGGYTVTAPGFTAERFDAAIGRAFADGLRIAATDRSDMVLVTNPRTGASYTTSRRSCSCKAGQAGTKCKHIAFAIFVADILGELPAHSGKVA